MLLNGADKVPVVDTGKYITNLLKTASGVEEIDGKDIKEGRPEEEIFRFDGALDLLGHIMNVYHRRLSKTDSVFSKMVFKAISDSGFIKKLIEEEDFMPMS